MGRWGARSERDSSRAARASWSRSTAAANGHERLAAEAGVEDVRTLEALVRAADIVLSVVPPGSAVEVAEAIATASGDARPLVADLNAIAPATARRVEEALAANGLETVDGSISGAPPHAPGTTRIYLSGPRAAEIAGLPLAGVELVVVGAEVGLASAVKMCTASVYKGRVALLAQALRTAHAHGVVEHVLDDLVDTGLADRGGRAERSGRRRRRRGATCPRWRRSPRPRRPRG